jgi:predicted component of type VI protein secretion system
MMKDKTKRSRHLAVSNQNLRAKLNHGVTRQLQRLIPNIAALEGFRGKLSQMMQQIIALERPGGNVPQSVAVPFQL